ncbi:hypothetical protein GCM10007972_26200 [Iodidimonas muriae]|uniref:STAS/SEC14 domain-containing protein n=1 Tax=Iodidimonas muriae TaxID=261467 RepID=A0ABQ2LG17_9PROT|nr:STAS/SEC14 domain-containing protein [Iodidimonas muriae]GER08477.1 hypothetical protein JCM17843_27870 [Kordiimonadales bacterium JCM 17843]GGO16767.1 hypothetical protein GCM10007972_26200 [Iodidimonas muriae]
MIRILKGFPKNALGVSHVGHVSAEDYAHILLPEIEKRIRRYGNVRLLVRISDDFQGFEPGAIWSDAKLGLRHWLDFSRLALVSDLRWLRDSTLFFGAFFPHPLKVFADDEFEAARAWLLKEESA